MSTAEEKGIERGRVENRTGEEKKNHLDHSHLSLSPVHVFLDMSVRSSIESGSTFQSLSIGMDEAGLQTKK